MRRWVLVLTSAAAFMVGLDVLVVTTALTTIQHELHASLGDLDWIMSAYTLSFAVLLMTAAALGDKFGRRRLLLAGLALFTAASAACAALPGISGLIAARAVQGVGAAMILPHAMALVAAAYPPQRRARALGLFTGVAGLAILSGPMIGGAIVQALSWRWIFLLNVPVGLVLLPLVRMRVPESQRVAARLDYAGVVLITGGAAGLAWALVRGNAAGWGSMQVVLPALGGVVLMAAFARWELRAAAPMLPMSLFRIRAFTAANSAGFLFYASMYGTVFFLAQYLQVNLRESPLGTGVRMLPLTITLSLIAPAAGALADRFGTRPLILAGLGLEASGLVWLTAATSARLGYLALIVPMAMIGGGASVAMPSLQAAPVSAVPAAAIGKASGAHNMLRQLGATFGVAIGSAVFAAAGGYSDATTFRHGFTATTGVCAVMIAVAGVIALAVPRRSRERVTAPAVSASGPSAPASPARETITVRSS